MFALGEHRAYCTGETVRLVVRARNVGKKDVKFSYFNEFFYEQPPTVTADKADRSPTKAPAYNAWPVWLK